MPVHERRSVRIGGLDVEYDDRVLEPRPWTALQSRWAVELLGSAPAGPVLELCTGAGHIGLLVAAATDRHLVAVDLDPVACSYARHNAEVAGLGDRVEVREGALATAVRAEERFVLVLADPPWVPSADIGRFPDDPTTAIDGGPHGLDVAHACVAAAAACTDPGADLLLQVGTDDQADLVAGSAVADGGWRDRGRRTTSRGVVLRLQRA
ncbi:methyltransferase domain-containing protein [Nocardioides plantarum]|uniref:Methyltransferase domain-containing protein n=1 Tax=Nocardioides plantarum TaxID=29299 RepID=A0ABV5KCX4_9ACTN|nr:methyltransferase domain-containing protein [Nocardioides plantarum]